MVSISYIQKRHSEFLALMDQWRTKTPLEATALICEEIGELAHELRQETVDKEKVGAELADIILRTVDLARDLEIDIESALVNKIDQNIRNIDLIKAKGRRL